MPLCPRPSPVAVRLACGLLLALLPAVPAAAYIDAPADRLTLPQLVKEFKSIELVEAESVDLERGVVVWRRVERLRGDENAAPVKHLLRLKGQVPEALGGLKPGARAVFFSRDNFGRGLVRTAGCWYLVGHEPDDHRWRIAYTDRWYDFNTAYIGEPDPLAAAVTKLLAGEEVVVPCRPKPGSDAVQTVRYSMKRLGEKVVVEPPTTRPVTAPATRPGQ
jgi:hypothetical protein